jgi:hypothetical protein
VGVKEVHAVLSKVLYMLGPGCHLKVKVSYDVTLYSLVGRFIQNVGTKLLNYMASRVRDNNLHICHCENPRSHSGCHLFAIHRITRVFPLLIFRNMQNVLFACCSEGSISLLLTFYAVL